MHGHALNARALFCSSGLHQVVCHHSIRAQCMSLIQFHLSKLCQIEQVLQHFLPRTVLLSEYSLHNGDDITIDNNSINQTILRLHRAIRDHILCISG